MKITKCDTCRHEFEDMDEYTSKQSVGIHIQVCSGRRNFPSGFKEGDFDSVKCANAWLVKLDGQFKN